MHLVQMPSGGRLVISLYPFASFLFRQWLDIFCFPGDPWLPVRAPQSSSGRSAGAALNFVSVRLARDFN